MINTEMKVSGFKWISEIPSKWKVSKIKFEVSVIGSGSTPESSNLDFYSENSFSWIQSGDLYQKQYIISTEKNITEHAIKRYSTLKFYEKDFVVIAMYGASTGNVSYSMISAYTNQACCVLKTSRDNCLKYLFYFIVISREYLIRLSAGGTQPNISQEKIKNFPFLKPSINEQKAIATFLDKKCSNIDSIISDLEKQIEILGKYRKSVITEAVTKGLNPNVKMKDSGVKWIGNIPDHWKITKMKFSSYMKGRIGWQGLTSKEYIDEGPYLVTGTDFYGGVINWESCVHVAEDRYKIAPEIMLKELDLLITKDGTVGKVAIVNNLPDKATLNSGVLLIRPIDYTYEVKYLYYVLTSKQFWDWFEWINNGGTTIIHLYQNVFSNFAFTLPPIEEQKQIINLLDKKVIEIDSTIEDKKLQVETIKKYKNSLIYEYVTGKKRVGQEDVNE